MDREELRLYLQRARTEARGENQRKDGEFTSDEYAEENGLSEATARRDLKVLILTGIVTRRSVSCPVKRTYYKFSNEFLRKENENVGSNSKRNSRGGGKNSNSVSGKTN